jgi:methionyl-tRNA synthetase
MEKKLMSKILVTSGLPYINGIKHLGNLVGSMLPADIYARYMRMQGHEVLYICGTDDHGAPAELGAASEGKDVEQFCEEKFEIQKDIYNRFGLSFDHFGRTSSKQNEELTQHMAKKLKENGFIEERTIQQIYSPVDGRFLPDRYVEGTCPHCKFEKARGDQCENCTKLLDPTDLINPYSAISGSTDLEVKETKHLFLLLDKLQPKVEEWVKTKIEWPSVVKGIANKWLKEGLKERCITRDMKWGVPVPFEGYEGKVFYVWFDAPIGYISITKEWSDEKPEERDYLDWWQNEDVKYVQFMGKDNLPFHTVMFPATIFGTGEKWKQVDYLKGCSWLNYYGGKFSTSSKRGIFTNQALEEFDADYWRYWLMANIPESSDSSFTIDSFAETINKDLNGVLGNFINRVLKMTSSKLSAEVPEIGEYTTDENELIAELKTKTKDYFKYMEEMEFRKALAELRAIWVAGNNYISKTEPWSVIKTDGARAKTILGICINLIRLFAILTHPVLPTTSNKILNKLNLTETDLPNFDTLNIEKELNFFDKGHKFEVGDPLFERITPERVDELKEKYGAEK